YSSADGSVIRYDIDADELKGRDALQADVASPVITAAGDQWALVDAEAGRVWVRGKDPVDLGTTEQLVVGDPDARGRVVYLAD
ncbi:hypothetical protein, partial [Staphylococcus aureus]